MGTLLFLVGPPAVGKMTVGRELEKLTGLPLLHNHHSIDSALRYFPFGTPSFGRLVGVIRRVVCEEVAASDLPGLLFTFVWAFDDPNDAAAIERYATPFRERGGRVLFVELQATQEERLRRNGTAERLAEKPHMRDQEISRARLVATDGRHQLDSRGAFAGRDDFLTLETTASSPVEVATTIRDHFGLSAAPSG